MIPRPPRSTLFPYTNALPISKSSLLRKTASCVKSSGSSFDRQKDDPDRKSTRLNSSHRTISYAVFCLKKKKIKDFREQLKSLNKLCSLSSILNMMPKVSIDTD